MRLMKAAKSNWAVEIVKCEGRIVWAWPYNVPTPALPPYPGFEILERWLEEYYPDSSVERLYNGGSPVLEIKFGSLEDAFMFVLASSQRSK